MGGGKETDKGRLIYETTRQGLNFYAQYQSIPRVASLFGRHFHVHLKLVYINADAAPGSLHEALLVSTSSQQLRVHIAASRRVVMLVFVAIRYRAAVITFHFIPSLISDQNIQNSFRAKFVYMFIPSTLGPTRLRSRHPTPPCRMTRQTTLVHHLYRPLHSAKHSLLGSFWSFLSITSAA